MRRFVARATALWLVVASGAAVPAAATAEEAGLAYQPPVDAPIAEHFRPPLHAYGAGNRGIDFATDPGQPVTAAEAGIVVFAGQVGGSLHVVLLHADGVRTSYSFLATVVVSRGDDVVAGAVLGTAGEGLHFGARLGDTYIDPALLLDGAGRAHLVPNRSEEPGTEAEERWWVVRIVRAVGGAAKSAGSHAIDWMRNAPATQIALLREEIALWIHYGRSLAAPVVLPLIALGHAWNARSEECTRGDVLPPAQAARRLLVLVAGLGSSSERAAAWRIDTDALGYRAGDVYRFSYAADAGRYTAADTQIDIRESARRLIAQVTRIRGARGGLPVDMVAHSQGGLVARTALVLGLRGVATLVTLGTPHGGADLATVARAVKSTANGAIVAGTLELLAGISPVAVSVAQMAETSDFIAWLADQPLPAETRVVSVAARNDWIVPNVRSRITGVDHVVVEVDRWPGVNEHDALPESAAAAREIALAVAGQEPTCQDFFDRFIDETQGRSISLVEDWIGLGAKVAVTRLR